MPTAHATRSALLVILALSAGALSAVDGDPDTSFSGNGISTWNDGGDVFVSAVAASDKLAFGIGGIAFEDGSDALHWHALDQAGNSANLGCAEKTDTLIPFSVATGLHAGIVDSTGKLLVGGSATFQGSILIHRAFIARFRLDLGGCELDESYSGNGWAIFDDAFCSSLECFILDLVEIPPTTGAVTEPRVVALVLNHTSEAKKRAGLLALRADGSIDSDFGIFGWAQLSIPGASEVQPERLARDGRGNLYVLAIRKVVSQQGTDYDEVVARFGASGGRDLSFGSDSGLEVVPDSTNTGTVAGYGTALEVANDGTLLAGYPAGADVYALYGYHHDSGAHGVVDTGLPNLHLAPQGNGRIVTAADVPGGDGVRLGRRAENPPASFPFDSSFGVGGQRTIDVDIGFFDDEDVTDLTLWNGRPLVAGYADNLNRSGFLLRTKSSYVFADGFEEGTPASWSSAPGIVFP